MTRTAIRQAWIVTPASEGVGDVLIEDDSIVSVGPRPTRSVDIEIDGTGAVVAPGLVRTHVHLFRTVLPPSTTPGAEWVWPFESALDRDALAGAARWGMTELLLSGTTSVLSMETTRHTDAALAAAADLGIRATIGPAIAEDSPVGPSADESWADLLSLFRRWHGAAGDRVRVAVSPRSPAALGPELWNDLLELAIRTDAIVHTHVSGSGGGSCEEGSRDVTDLHRLGALTRRTVLAHGAPLSDEERSLVHDDGASLTRCPEPGPAGAFARTTALAARALGLGPRVGRIQPGMKADIVVFDAPRFVPGEGSSARDHLAEAASERRARTVLVDGRVVVDDFTLRNADARRIRADGEAVRARLREQTADGGHL